MEKNLKNPPVENNDHMGVILIAKKVCLLSDLLLSYEYMITNIAFYLKIYI